MAVRAHLLPPHAGGYGRGPRRHFHAPFLEVAPVSGGLLKGKGWAHRLFGTGFWWLRKACSDTRCASESLPLSLRGCASPFLFVRLPPSHLCGCRISSFVHHVHRWILVCSLAHFNHVSFHKDSDFAHQLNNTVDISTLLPCSSSFFSTDSRFTISSFSGPRELDRVRPKESGRKKCGWKECAQGLHARFEKK